MILSLEELSRVQVRALDFNSTVALIPISPLEEHGPHLPVGTDLYISSGLAEQLARMIEQKWPHLQVVLCPLVPLGARAVSGPGTISIGQRALHDVLFDYVRGLARSHFRFAVFCSAHGSIEHFVVLEEVAERSLKELGIRVEPALSRVVLPFLMGRYVSAIESRLGRPLTEQERLGLKSDCHGGQWETGYILDRRPDLVHEEYRSLPPILMKGWLHLRRCMAASCAQEMGYVGAPAYASVEYSRAAAEVLLEITLEQVDQMLHSPHFRPSHTPFYYLPIYRTPRAFTSRQLAGALSAGLLAGAALAAAGRWLLRDREDEGNG